MTAMMIRGYLEAELRRLGFPYTLENGYMLLTAGLAGRRWKMAIACGENRVMYYAAYPRQVPRERRAACLDCLNNLNAALSFGGFFLLDTGPHCLIVFRGDVLIADEYSVAECLESGFKHTTAAFYARWETMDTLCGVRFGT